MTRAVALLVLVSWMVGCEGPVGPAGPRGETGPAGPLGPIGNANVLSVTHTLQPVDFAVQLTAEVAIFHAPAITEAVVTGGVVLAFTDFAAPGDAWAPLPRFMIVGYEITFIYDVGEFGVIITRVLGAPPAASILAGSRVRYVVIAPSENAALRHVDKSN